MTDVLAEVARDSRALIRAREKRDTTIRKALAEGASLRAVARAAGLTHVRVIQIRDAY